MEKWLKGLLWLKKVNMEEIEVKFLDIVPEDIEKKVLSLGGKKVYDRVYVDKVFDYPDWRLNSNNAWIRLRDKGDKITLTYKQRFGEGENGNDKGMYEVEFGVSDFDKVTEFFKKIGMIQKFHEEKRCVHFLLNEVEVNIDTWPLMPSYVEIEGNNWSEVQTIAESLGFDWKKRVILSGMQVYEKYGINESEYEVLTFSEQKKRNG